MKRRQPRSTRTDHSCPTRRSSVLKHMLSHVRGEHIVNRALLQGTPVHKFVHSGKECKRFLHCEKLEQSAKLWAVPNLKRALPVSCVRIHAKYTQRPSRRQKFASRRSEKGCLSTTCNILARVSCRTFEIGRAHV